MQYFIDSANAAVIAVLCRDFPVAGVTTNPTIIAREKGDFKTVLLAVREAVGDRLLHAQVTAETASLRSYIIKVKLAVVLTGATAVKVAILFSLPISI